MDNSAAQLSLRDSYPTFGEHGTKLLNPLNSPSLTNQNLYTRDSLAMESTDVLIASQSIRP